MKHLKRIEDFDPMGSWDPKHPSNLKMKLIPTLKAYLMIGIY
jgi:hypothetical protein